MEQQVYDVTGMPGEVVPTVGSCYGNGWENLWKHFLELFLIFVVMLAFAIPNIFLSLAETQARGAGYVFLVLLGWVYSILLLNPLQYGVNFACLKAARREAPAVKDLFEVFQNYWAAVLANLLVGIIILVGLVLLIVPGIIFACKLAFVPYLIVERRMEVIQAVKTSWNMTTGHAVTIFLMGLLAIPLAIAGLLVLCVGIIPAILWIGVAFASMYHAVSSRIVEAQPVETFEAAPSPPPVE